MIPSAALTVLCIVTPVDPFNLAFTQSCEYATMVGEQQYVEEQQHRQQRTRVIQWQQQLTPTQPAPQPPDNSVNNTVPTEVLDRLLYQTLPLPGGIR